MPEKAGLSYLSLGFVIMVIGLLSPTVQTLMIGIGISAAAGLSLHIVQMSAWSWKDALRVFILAGLAGTLFVLWTYEFIFPSYPILWHGGCFLAGLMGERFIQQAMKVADRGLKVGGDLALKKVFGSGRKDEKDS